MAKGFTILLVVIGHSIPNASFANSFIFSFHMPFFFIIAGYTLNAKKGFSEFFAAKVKRLLLPYFFTVLFDVLFWILIGRALTNDISNLFANFSFSCKSYAIGLGQVADWAPVNPVGVVWFIPCLFLSVIIFFVIIKLCRNDMRWIGVASTISVIAGYFIGRKTFLPWSLDVALFSQIFLFSGYYLKSNMLIEKKFSFETIVSFIVIWVIGVFSFPISMNNRDYSIVIVPIFSAVCASILIMKLMRNLERIKVVSLPLQYLGKISLIILIFHLKDIGSLHLNLIPELEFLYAGYKYCFLVIIGRLGMSILFAEVFRRIPFINVVYGLKSQKAIGGSQSAPKQ